MSLGSSDMAGAALGTAFSLLFLASIIQGFPEVFHHKRMEAVVGHNVTLPCIVKEIPGHQIVSIEWRKKQHVSQKLALYSQGFGIHLFWPNVTMQIDNASMGSSLQLYGVTTQDSGIYICDISSFPLGSFQSETVLEIKDDVNITCDVDSAVEVHSGENVTIKCKLIPDAKYKWTKNETLVSDNESLELCGVADAHTGIYTLTVNTGNKSLEKVFVITVLTATTSLNIDLVTVPPQFTVTEEGRTSPTTGLSTTDADVTWTMSTRVKDENPNSRNVTTEDHMTSSTNSTHASVTPSPITQTDPYPLNNSTDPEIHPTHKSNTDTLSDQSVAFNLSTTISYGNTGFRSTYETKNESTRGNPGASPTLSTGYTTIVIDEGTGDAQSHLLSLIIVPILVLIVVAGFLYLRRIRKKRMSLPPPFKPPPPPVKYTAARHHEISTQSFPTSRCGSVMEPKEMRQTFINV